LKENIKNLQYHKGRDLIRIQRKIDDLYGLAAKQDQNKLVDDSKRTQGVIADLKGIFGDLQKDINDLNRKHYEVGQHATTITAPSADKEMEIQLKEDIFDRLAEIDSQINGEERKPEPSLNDQKKQIIAELNKIVTDFNDNNKKVKEASKSGTLNDQIKAMQDANKQIEDRCK
jgi:hypothetical protein